MIPENRSENISSGFMQSVGLRTYLHPGTEYRYLTMHIKHCSATECKLVPVSAMKS